MCDGPPDDSDTAVTALVDRIGCLYAAGQFMAQAGRAREFFDQRRGRVFDDDAVYAAHMTRFLQWYVLDRPLDESGQTPVSHFIAAKGLQPEEGTLALALASSHCSVFEVLGQRGGTRLYDLVGSGHWLVNCAEELPQGVVLDARLYWAEPSVRLAPGLLFHPPAARTLIRAIVAERQGKGRLDAGLGDDLSQMLLRFHRFRNIAIHKIYCQAD